MNRNAQKKKILIGDTEQKQPDKKVRGGYVRLLGEPYYRIQNYDGMEPFFMNIVSSSDHWLFISSTGGLTAGRVSPDQALFPYYTEDKLAENSENTGHKAILLVSAGERSSLWEPFSVRNQGNYQTLRNIYKNIPGTTLIFEEINLDLGLTYRYAWRTGEKFGFVKTSWLINTSKTACRVDFLDGLQNILPAGITSLSQNTFSPLLNAYKRSELDPASGLAIFVMNSNLTDLAEPSESLVATCAAQLGLDQADYLLCADQLDRFRQGQGVETETEVRGSRCAYFVHSLVDLAPGSEHTWHLFADVYQDSATIVQKIKALREDRTGLWQELENDLQGNSSTLQKLVAQADGLELSSDRLCNAHHFSNVMFNIMRGGIFADQDWINKKDLLEFASSRDRAVQQKQTAFFASLPERFTITDLQDLAERSGSPELIRLGYSYLPLTFSRRHGDPSRPWNQFATRIKNADGSLRLDYQGNWRDIFQNWEALSHSYPEFVESMICTFLNATTADGYNPYRITSQGIDWELPEPGNPWANLGYWNDHQIIYLQKLMETSARFHPGWLHRFLVQPVFSVADVPYRIKPYADLLKDPFNTILFDWDRQRAIEARLPEKGADGKLVWTPQGRVLQVTLAEKLLTLLLAKLANFVPEGGIWMNTQRPEWNDANNALVGKGLSVVTLCYLRRYVSFCLQLFEEARIESLSLSSELQAFFSQALEALVRFQDRLDQPFSDEDRRRVMDALGEAGSHYRAGYYRDGFSGKTSLLPVKDIGAFLGLVQRYIDQTLRANKRGDNLYHAYNVLHLGESRASISHLYEMLEGQVAILSSGLLSGDEALRLLESLRNGPLYQSGQNSYILYPDREVPGFLEKNRLSPGQVAGLGLFPALAGAGDRSLILRDADGIFRFSGPIRNARDVSRALETLKKDPGFRGLVEQESQKILELFEAAFHHDQFTGRSGTFFAYEGLGSVYWHMVTKLLLAVQETILLAGQETCRPALIEKYHEIRAGLSFTKSPERYGAFPTDAYSHTPKGHGAKQPGMTGSVKEEILTRKAELGLFIENGRLVFEPLLLDPREFLRVASQISYPDVNGRTQKLELGAGCLVFFACQTPVVLKKSKNMRVTVYYSDGGTREIEGNVLDDIDSRHIFQRDGTLHHLLVSFPAIEK